MSNPIFERADITVLAFGGKEPQIHPSAFIAPGCRIIGDVTIGANASIWYNCVIRADVNSITIGARSNLQDGSVIHCDGPTPMHPQGFPTIIGEEVLIGHMAMIHGCTIAPRGFVGLGATVMNGAYVASDAMLGAGALLSEGKQMGERELWIGRPAKAVRKLDDAALEAMRMGVDGYAQKAQAHMEALTRAGLANGAENGKSD